MNKPRRRVMKNHELRRELINKGHIIPIHLVPQHLRSKGFLEAAKAAKAQLDAGRRLFTR